MLIITGNNTVQRDKQNSIAYGKEHPLFVKLKSELQFNFTQVPLQ